MLRAADCLNDHHNLYAGSLRTGLYQMIKCCLVVLLGSLGMLSIKLCVLVIEYYTILLIEVPIEVMTFAASCGSKDYLRIFLSA